MPLTLEYAPRGIKSVRAKVLHTFQYETPVVPNTTFIDIFNNFQPHLLTYIQEDEKFTTGVMAGVVGVAIIGGLANTAIAATGKSVSNGTLIFYAGFARQALETLTNS